MTGLLLRGFFTERGGGEERERERERELSKTQEINMNWLTHSDCAHFIAVYDGQTAALFSDSSAECEEGREWGRRGAMCSVSA